MSANRNRQKKLNQQMNTMLVTAEEQREVRERQRSLYLKGSDFLLDLAKLGLAGIILTGIIDLNLDKAWLFVLGAMVTGVFSAWGFYMYQRGIKIK